MKEMERLLSHLFPTDGSKQLHDLKFFEGEDKVRIEEFCEEAHAAFVQVDSGQVKPETSFPEKLTRVSVDKFLAD